jgi:dTDP-4-amino-4,6-dideoxygalactose transaminase
MIEFFDYPGLYKRHEKEMDRIFKDVCSRGAFILQEDLERFENNLSNALGGVFVLGVADGTNAMVLGLMAAGIKPGDEVIIASHTYVATANALKMVGAKPVFADIGSDNLMDAVSAEKKISNNTKAIMPTQLNGRCCAMDRICAIAEQYGLAVFEDSAQGLGAKYKGKHAGTFGQFGTFSFYPAKTLGCFGDGGAIVTKDKAFYKKLHVLRDHGRDSSGNVVAWGTNCRLDNLQAAFLDFKLGKFHEDISRRREIASKYDKGLAHIDELRLPPAPTAEPHYDVYQNYELAAKDRDNLRAFLSDKGVKTIIQWSGVPVHHFEQLGLGRSKFSDLRSTGDFFDKCMMLLTNLSLSDNDVNHISVNKFFV